MPTPKVISATTVEPLTLAEACEHLRLVPIGSPGEYPDEELVEGLITTSREMAEEFMGRSIVRRVLELALDQFPVNQAGASRAVVLPRGPVQAVSSVSYDDAAGSANGLTDYQLDTHNEPARLAPAVGASWPTTWTGAMNAARIRYVAGYYRSVGSPGEETFDALPKTIKSAMKLILGHLYENREDTSVVKLEEIPTGAKALLRPYRIQDASA